jgi:hypothetical protein
MPDVTRERKATRSRKPKPAAEPAAPKATGRFLSQASTDCPPSRNIMFFHGKSGIGKSALLAHAPKPVFLIDPLEKGILKLMERGLVPKVDVVPAFRNYADFYETLEDLASGKHGYQTVVIDSITGIEQLLFQYVADELFEGRLNKDGFYAYGAGPNMCMKNYWPNLFKKIEDVREAGCDVYITGHSIVQAFNSPFGDSYDRYEPVLDKKSWKAIDRVMDNVFFMDRHIEMDNSKLKSTAKDTDNRIIHCEWSPAYDAKNRLNMPPIIQMGNSGAEAWKNFSKALEIA